MKKIIVSMMVLAFLVSCSSKVETQRTRNSIYTFNNVSSKDMADAAMRCFSPAYYKNGYTRCSTRGATMNTLFKANNKIVKIRNLVKTESINSREGLVTFYATSTGGVFFNVTLFVHAGVIIDEYTGKVKTLIAYRGNTVDFDKSQGLIDSEPGLKILKKGYDLMLKQGRK